LFIGDLHSVGTDIKLTTASNIAFLELPWPFGLLLQAEDCCYKTGQKVSINIYYLFAAGTIEERITKLIDRRPKVVDIIETDTASFLSELINEYKCMKL
jgi:SNF2 family DNA or RNA helicase